MPEELVAIAIISIIAGTFLVLGLGKMIIGYLRDRSASSGGAALTESQLRGLVREAVEDAVEPLYDRVEQLEAGEHSSRLLEDSVTGEDAVSLTADDDRERSRNPRRRRS